MRKVFSAFAAIVMSLQVSAEHRGIVFVDKNSNGKYDKGETLKSDVAVSDGLHVVRTNKKGEFVLEGHDKERFVFITTPSGYKTYNTFYKPITGSTANYEFGIIPSEGVAKDGSHSFIQISDTEIRETQGHESWISDIRNYAKNEDCAFIIHTGDICYPQGLESHIEIMNTKNMACPVFYTIGNHDLVKGEYGEQMYEKLYGPSWYSFDVGNVHYIVTPMLGGDYAPKYKKEDVYHWLKNDLASIDKDKSIYIFSHDICTTSPESMTYGISTSETIDLEEHNLKAWLYGHWHINNISRHGNAYAIGTSTPIRGGIDHTTSSFRVLQIDSKGDFQTNLRYPYINSIEIASINMNKAPISQSGIAPISVNVYKSESPTVSVSFTAKLGASSKTIRGKLEQKTDWNWTSNLNLATCNDGEPVTVSVVAQFANGESTQSSETFVVDKNMEEVKLGENWTNLLKNSEHRGISKDTLGTNLNLAWTTNLGSNVFMSSPIIFEGMVYTATIDETMHNNTAVFAMDAKTGEIKWRYATKRSIKNSIAIDGGNVFAQDVEGNLYAIDAKSGKLAWEKQLDVSKTIPTLLEGLATKNSIVYAGTGQGLSAIDAKTGKEIWINQDWNQGYSSTSTITAGAGVVVLGTQWGALYANDIKTGKKLWHASGNGLRNRASSPAVYEDLLYLLSLNSLFVINPQSGAVITRKEFPYSVDVTSTPLITDSEIIIGTAAQGIVALDKNTLEERWTFRTDEAMIYTVPYVAPHSSMIESSPILCGNTVYIGGLDGTLYALDRKKGTMLWQHDFGSPIFTSPSASGNSLFVCDFAGNVYGFSSKK